MKSQGLVTLELVIALLSHTLVLTTSQFTVQPVSVVQAQGLDAVFECRYPGASNHLWKLNGKLLTDDSYPRDVTVSPPSGDTPATLTIQATAQYRNTVVQCVALVRGEQRFIHKLSVNSTLQVQEPFPAVTDLTVAGNCLQLNVTWVAPFSLNLTTAEPDIQYCVDVFNVTYEREENLLQSECNITTTQYLFDVPYLVGTSSFSVTPRSNIDGSLNGTTSTGQFSHDTCTDTLTPVTDVVDNSTTVIVGRIAAAAATTVVIIAFLVVIAFVWRRKRREKRTTLVIEMQNTSLLENDYVPPLSLNREYSVPSEAAGGPPPIPAYQYENVELMSLTRATEPPVSIDEPPPSYKLAATSKPFKQDMDEGSVLSSTLSSPDHVPISADWTGHNVSTLERSNHDTAPKHSANNRVTQAMEASENEQVASVHMEGGTSTTQQPHDQSMESTPKDPVYDVVNSLPTQNKNKTEITVVYTDLDVKPKADSTPPMQHPVVHALIDESSLAPRTVENDTTSPCPLPLLSPPPTAESVLAEIYPVAKRWKALGKALGIKKHHLDSFSTRKALCEIEEIAVEIKIVRSRASTDSDINETPDKKEHDTAMNQKINVHNVSTLEHRNSSQVSKIRMSAAEEVFEEVFENIVELKSEALPVNSIYTSEQEGRQVYPNPCAATPRDITISNSTK